MTLRTFSINVQKYTKTNAMNKIDLIESKYLFTHTRFNVKHDKVLINDHLNNYVYIDKTDAVGIIPLVNDEVWLVDQYRHSVGERLLEIPGGRMEMNESPLEATKRELKEETGLIAKNIELFLTIFIHPSLCNEKVHIFIANDFVQPEDQTLDYSEVDLRVKKIKINKLKDLLTDNQILSSPDGYVLSLFLLKTQ